MPECSDPDFGLDVPQNLITFVGDGKHPNECIAKCIYWYNYGKSTSCNITTNETYLSIPYDGAGEIIYNSGKYKATTIRIYSPSLHKYDGAQADAEMIIQHSNSPADTAGLLVCIPISKTAARSNGSVIIETIIDNAPIETNSSESATLANFNLNTIIPSAPYYSYTGPAPYDNCNPDLIFQYVVFHPSSEGAIGVSESFIDKLKSLISYSFINAVEPTSTTLVSFNPTGTSKNGFNGEDQIYIQCQPVGESEETEVYKEPASPFKNIGNPNDALTVLMFIVLGAIFIIGAYYLMNYLTKFIKYTPPVLKAKPVAASK